MPPVSLKAVPSFFSGKSSSLLRKSDSAPSLPLTPRMIKQIRTRDLSLGSQAYFSSGFKCCELIDRRFFVAVLEPRLRSSFSSSRSPNPLHETSVGPGPCLKLTDAVVIRRMEAGLSCRQISPGLVRMDLPALLLPLLGFLCRTIKRN